MNFHVEQSNIRKGLTCLCQELCHSHASVLATMALDHHSHTRIFSPPQHFSIQHFTTRTLLHNTRLQHFTTQHFPTQHVQHVSTTLPYNTFVHNTSLHITSNTSLQHFPTHHFQHFSTTLPYNASLHYYSSTPYYKVLHRTTKYYSVLQTYYKVLFQNYSVLQSSTLYYKVLQKLPKRAFRARLPQLVTTTCFKMIISCEAFSTFQATSFQNEHFVRGFLNFSLQLASETSISCEASSTFQATSFQKEHFVGGFLNFSTKASRYVLRIYLISHILRKVLAQLLLIIGPVSRGTLRTSWAVSARFKGAERFYS